MSHCGDPNHSAFKTGKFGTWKARTCTFFNQIKWLRSLMLPMTQNCIQVSIYLIFSQYKTYQTVINNQLLLCYCCCSVTKSCLTLCNTADCSLPGSSVQESPSKNTGVNRHFLLQVIFLTQESNWCLVSPALRHLWSLSHQNLYHWATRKLCRSVE